MPDFFKANVNNPVKHGSIVTTPPRHNTDGIIYDNSMVVGDIDTLNNKYQFKFDDGSYPIISSGDVVTGNFTFQNSSLTITYPHVNNRAHEIGGINWGVQSTLTSGTVIVSAGGQEVFHTKVTAAGNDGVVFNPTKVGMNNAAMTVTLAGTVASGLTVPASLTVNGHRVV